MGHVRGVGGGGGAREGSLSEVLGLFIYCAVLVS